MKKALLTAIAAAAAISAGATAMAAPPAHAARREVHIRYREAERLRAELTQARWLEQRFRGEISARPVQLVGVPSQGSRDAV